MDNDKITINGKDFYVIPQCQIEKHTLCVAAESWGDSTWGDDTNGQRILDVADNRNPKSLTHAWYESLPEDTKEAILTVRVTTDDYSADGKGLLEQTEMFVPSYEEWRKLPRNVRKVIAKDDCWWSRSYYGAVYGSSLSWCIISDGNLYCGNQSFPSAVSPAFYLEDNFLESLLSEQKVQKGDINGIFLEELNDCGVSKTRETTLITKLVKLLRQSNSGLSDASFAYYLMNDADFTEDDLEKYGVLDKEPQVSPEQVRLHDEKQISQQQAQPYNEKQSTQPKQIQF